MRGQKTNFPTRAPWTVFRPIIADGKPSCPWLLMVRYVTNLLLLDTPSLWHSGFAAPVWSGVDKMLSTCLDNLELYNLVRYTANIKESFCSPHLSLIALFKKLYCHCLTKPGKGDILSSIRHRSLAAVLRTPSKHFITLIYNFSTTWQLTPPQLSHPYSMAALKAASTTLRLTQNGKWRLVFRNITNLCRCFSFCLVFLSNEDFKLPSEVKMVPKYTYSPQCWMWLLCISIGNLSWSSPHITINFVYLC